MVRNVFILAPGHSGSTLLNLILGAHREVAAVSELTNLPVNVARNRNCTCGAAILECEFWQAVARRVKELLGIDLFQNPYDLNLGFMEGSHLGDAPSDRRGYRALWKMRHAVAYATYRTGIPLAKATHHLASSVSNTLAVYEAVRLAGGASIVVDASKSYIKGIGIYEREPQTTRLLLLTRDGRASYYSRLKRGVARDASLAAWRDYYARALPLLGRVVSHQHVVRVRYEDLASQPMVEVRRICESLSLSFEPQMLRFYETLQHSVGGNNMRFRGQQEIRLDSSWSDKLSRDDLQYFEKHAGPLNRALGYQ